MDSGINDVDVEVVVNEDIVKVPVKKGTSEAKKRTNKKYAEANPEKVKEIKRKYYYKQKELKEQAIKEAERLRTELEAMRLRLNNL
jgi:hypothetical protein